MRVDVEVEYLFGLILTSFTLFFNDIFLIFSQLVLTTIFTDFNFLQI